MDQAFAPNTAPGFYTITEQYKRINELLPPTFEEERQEKLAEELFASAALDIPEDEVVQGFQKA